VENTTVREAQPLVLIADDNEQNLKLARDVLLAAGFRTAEAATGAGAVALAHRRLPDVILMDLRLPDMDGAEAARMLAADAQTAKIPVVAFSSLTVSADGDWLRSQGFAGFLEKPIDVSAFPHQVRRYCTGRQPE
jgi:two-component system, cell cycle response regulator DivK